MLTVPLPKDDKAFQEEVDSDIESDDLDEEDLELLEASAGELEFLHKLPKKDIDKAVSQTREKKPLPRHTEDNRHKRNVSDIETESSDLESEEDDSSDEEEDSESEEEDWEKGPRKIQQERPKQVKKHRGGSLPVKSLDGDMLEHPDAIVDEDLRLDQNAFEGVTVLDDGRASKKEEKLKVAEMERKKQQELRELQKKKEREQEEIRLREEESKVDIEEQNKDKKYKEEALQCLQGCKSKDERRGKAKFVIAKACQTLLGDPEHQLRKQMPILLELIGDYDINIVKLSMLSVLAIMRDIIPSYRIRPIHEREKEDVVQSKEVKELWDHESLLLKSYQSYLKVLLKAFKNQKDGSKSAMILSRAAAKCLSSLVVAAPHFNFSGDILQVIVPAIANKDEEIKSCCSNAITSLVKEALSSADSGQCAVEATQLLADFVKRRKCVGLPPQVVSCLLDFSFPDITSAEDLLEATKNRKKKKKKKNKDDVNRAFREAQAVVDRDTRRHQQSVVLEAMFEIYFRVLKTTEASLKGIQQVQSAWPPARFAKRFPLMAPTLQGLANFSHLISVDYFQDLIVTLENILESPCIPHDIRCRILLTASEISKGQGESLNIDRAALYRELYRAMYSATEIPMEEDDPSLPGTLSDKSMTHHLPPTTLSSVPMPKDTQQYLLSKILEDMLLDSQKTLDIQRQAAFTKRAATIALQATDSGLVLAMLYVIYRMLKRYPKLRSMIEDDEGAGPSSNYYGSLLSKGQSKKTSVEYAQEDPAIHTGALYTPLWELSILAAHHANPGVRQAANFVAIMSVSAARAAATGITGESASELSHIFPVQTGFTMSPSTVLLSNTTYLGAFAPPVTRTAPSRRRRGGGSCHQEERPIGRWIGILDAQCPGFERKANS